MKDSTKFLRINKSSQWFIAESSSSNLFSSQFWCEFITNGDKLKHDHEGIEFEKKKNWSKFWTSEEEEKNTDLFSVQTYQKAHVDLLFESPIKTR
jgi:hypothetical protein